MTHPEVTFGMPPGIKPSPLAPLPKMGEGNDFRFNDFAPEKAVQNH
jgi:hypothetical protein